MSAKPSKFKAYLQLIRFDKPVGTMLLLWPTLWACPPVSRWRWP